MQAANQDIETATDGLHKFIHKQLTQNVSIENAIKIAKYIKCQKTEINLSDNYRRTVVTGLINLARYFKNKNFDQLKSSDIINCLDSLRKTEDTDPTHKWIGTYNLRRQIFLKFFKWLYYPTIESTKRPVPEVMRGISSLKRKELSIYKPYDMWSPEDDQIFLKYCADKRIQCYHAIARDTSARPSEILNFRVKEINFMHASDKTYAVISLNGKTGTRTVPLFNSIPYIKDWLNNHPQSGNSNAFLIPSLNRSTFCHKMGENSLNRIYNRYKTKLFPRFINDESIPIEDKNKIQQLLKKPWNPYVRRHTGLTEKSKMKYLNEHQLRQYAGWSARSQMPLKYIHYFNNEASDTLLEAYGVVTREQELAKTLHYKQCPNCNEPNKPECQFCVKCKIALTFEACNEALEIQKQKEASFSAMERQVNLVQSQLKNLISALGNMNGDNKNNFAKELFRSGVLEVENKSNLI